MKVVKCSDDVYNKIAKRADENEYYYVQSVG